jgi:hypothetical protein
VGGGGAMSKLGFVGCHGGGAGDLLQGVEDVRWVAAGPMVRWGGEVVGAPPQPRVDGRRRRGWWGGAGMERRTCRAGDERGGGRYRDERHTHKEEEGVAGSPNTPRVAC